MNNTTLTIPTTPDNLFSLNTIKDKRTCHGYLLANGMLLQYMNENFKKDPETIFLAVTKTPKSFQYAHESLRDDKTMALFAIEKHFGNFEFVSERLQKDTEVVFSAIRKGAPGQLVPQDLLKDRVFALEALDLNGFLFKDLAAPLKKDIELINIAMKEGLGILRHADPEILKDKTTMSELAKKDLGVLYFADPSLTNDKSFMSEMVELFDGEALRYAGEQVTNDKEIVVQALRKSSYNIRFASEEIRASTGNLHWPDYLTFLENEVEREKLLKRTHDILETKNNLSAL